MRSKWLLVIPLVLILLVLCAAIAAVLIISLRSVDFSDISLPISRSLNFTAEEQEERSFSVDGPAKLYVDNRTGPVHVEAGTGNTIQIRADKTAHGANQQQAEENLEKMEIDMTQTGDTVRVKFEVPQTNTTWSGAVDFTIIVPEQTEVYTTSQVGDLSLEGTQGAAELNTEFGSITVRDVRGGALTVVTRNGRVEARGVQAGAQTVDLKSDFGDVTLADAAAGAVSLESNNGALTLDDVSAGGKVTLNSEFGRIEFNTGSADGLEVNTQNGSITLTGLETNGSLVAVSDFGEIKLDQVQAPSYDLKSQNGAISVNGATGPIKAHSDFGSVTVEDAQEATLDLSSGNGTVSFEGSLGSGPHTLHSELGAVTLRLPAGSAFDFDLQTDFGKISSDFEITIQGEPDEEHWQGKINGGGDLLTVTTNNGNITLEAVR